MFVLTVRSPCLCIELAAPHARKVSQRRQVSAAAVVVCLIASGCGAQLGVGGPESGTYNGPLWVEPAPGLDLWEDPGAAGRVVDCDGAVVGGSKASPFTGGEVGETAEAALREAYDEGAWDGVVDVDEVRREPDRVLYSYAAEGRTRQAVIVRHGPAAAGTGAGADGMAWWVESWARCNIAEFSARVAADRNVQIWTDATGRRLPTTTIVSSAGGSCVPGATFIRLGVPGKDIGDAESQETYVAGAGPEYADFFNEPYRRDVSLPPDAVDTGYSRDGQHLWLSPDHRRAYIVRSDRVELWPRTTQLLGCA